MAIYQQKQTFAKGKEKFEFYKNVVKIKLKKTSVVRQSNFRVSQIRPFRLFVFGLLLLSINPSILSQIICPIDSIAPGQFSPFSSLVIFEVDPASIVDASRKTV